MSFGLQQTIKNNATDLREYVKDLYDWEQEMEHKEKMRSKKRQQEQKKREELHKQQEQIQKQKEMIKEQESKAEEPVKKKKQLIRDKNTVQDYYKAWDQYDVDKELEKLQEEETAKYRPYNPYEDSKNNRRAKPKAGLVVKGNRNVNMVKDPTSLKDKGNLHFKVSEFQKAVDCYSDCLNKIQEKELEVKGKNLEQTQKQIKDRNKLKAVVLSNRAMALMKLNQTAKALLDCTESLAYDDKYIKTYLRRADCFKKLGRYKDSLKDYKNAQEISPEEKEAETEIKKIETFLAKKVKQAHEGMIIQSIPEVIPSGYRIQIEQLEDFDESDEKEEREAVNYLEEI